MCLKWFKSTFTPTDNDFIFVSLTGQPYWVIQLVYGTANETNFSFFELISPTLVGGV